MNRVENHKQIGVLLHQVGVKTYGSYFLLVKHVRIFGAPLRICTNRKYSDLTNARFYFLAGYHVYTVGIIHHYLHYYSKLIIDTNVRPRIKTYVTIVSLIYLITAHK